MLHGYRIAGEVSGGMSIHWYSVTEAVGGTGSVTGAVACSCYRI